MKARSGMTIGTRCRTCEWRSLKCFAAMIVCAGIQLSTSGAVGEDQIPSDALSYRAIVKNGRPANLYQGVDVKEQEVCGLILDALNRPFQASDLTALWDKEYLLHTGYEAALQPVSSRTQYGSVVQEFQIVVGQLEEKRDPLVLTFSSEVGGTPYDRLILANPELLNLKQPIPIDQVRALLGSDQPRRYASVRTGEWRLTQNVLEEDTPQYRFFIQDFYSAIPISVTGRYFGLVSSPVLFSGEEGVIRSLIVLVYALDWQTLSEPLCVFKLAA